MAESLDRNQVLASAINSIAAFIAQSSYRAGRPVLVGPNGQPIKSANYQYQRQSAQRKGSMKTWIPRRLMSDQQVGYDRERIVERSIDLINNDPHAAGVVDTFATTIVGSGLNPHPSVNPVLLNGDKEKARLLQDQQKAILKIWSPFADAGQRMSFWGLQYLAQRNIIEFGEYLFLLPMIRDNSRPYSLAVQSINPLRLKTPVDLINRENIKDGVQVGSYGQPIAYYIKKAEASQTVADTSDNFLRIRAKRGHRYKVLHGFISNESEQVRGVPFFSPAMKFFRDLSDYLDAELVSNIVTAAFSMFIETGATDPLFPAQNMATITETGYKSDGSEYDQRYQEMVPGSVPGATFEPFIKTIARSISLSLNIPYPVLFKDFEGMNYASYRSAMLEAWRVFKQRRTWLGSHFCQPIHRMLLEEAYLRGDYAADNFYENMFALTDSEWIGPPKGQIEPIKEVQADILAIQNNLKTRETVILEQGRDLKSTFEQLEEEQGLMDEKGLTEVKIEPQNDNQLEDKDNNDGTD
jgi:lambda family phage portal protein